MGRDHQNIHLNRHRRRHSFHRGRSHFRSGGQGLDVGGGAVRVARPVEDLAGDRVHEGHEHNEDLRRSHVKINFSKIYDIFQEMENGNGVRNNK